jgi:hypothetical protein
MIQKNMLKWKKNNEIYKRRGEGFVTQPRRLLGMSSEGILAVFPLVPGKNLQRTASKSLLEMLQNTKMLRKILCFYKENFHIKVSK